MQRVWADQGCTGAFADGLKAQRGWRPDVVRHPEGQLWRYGLAEKPRGVFRAVPRRWVVERTFAWLGRSRRTSCDYERLPATGEAMNHHAMTRLMLRRREPEVGGTDRGRRVHPPRHVVGVPGAPAPGSGPAAPWPRRRPACVAGDTGYSTPAIRRWCRRHHVRAVIPERSDQVAQRSHRRGRKPAFDPVAYRRRNVVERVVGWLKNLRRVASRSEKLATHVAAVVTVALIGRYANACLSDTTERGFTFPPGDTTDAAPAATRSTGGSEIRD
jgi:transposase